MLLVVEQQGLRLRVGNGWGASRQVDSFVTELGVKLVWSIGGCNEARST